jgi:hypothetical protein
MILHDVANNLCLLAILHVEGHGVSAFLKRAIVNDHLANVGGGNFDVGGIIWLIRRGLGLTVAVPRVFAGIVRVCVLWPGAVSNRGREEKCEK